MKTYHALTEFSFGKHSGKFLDEIASLDPAYIPWCILNLDHFYITGDMVTTLSANHPKLYFGDEVFKALKKKEEIMAEVNRKAVDVRYIDSSTDYPHASENEYYNDNLDMDQQSMEFWNEIG